MCWGQATCKLVNRSAFLQAVHSSSNRSAVEVIVERCQFLEQMSDSICLHGLQLNWVCMFHISFPSISLNPFMGVHKHVFLWWWTFALKRGQDLVNNAGSFSLEMCWGQATCKLVNRSAFLQAVHSSSSNRSAVEVIVERCQFLEQMSDSICWHGLQLNWVWMFHISFPSISLNPFMVVQKHFFCDDEHLPLKEGKIW